MTNSASTADPYIYIVMLPQTTGCLETGRSTPQKFSEERFNCTRATTLMQSQPAMQVMLQKPGVISALTKHALSAYKRLVAVYYAPS